jgi:hypothetical protein|tara:strand:+ start:767 stop:1006 length:240 start_codon:yes stop_codon:yes gene_type:complete
MTTMTHGFSLQSVDAANEGEASLFGSGRKEMSLTSSKVAVMFATAAAQGEAHMSRRRSDARVIRLHGDERRFTAPRASM